MVSYDLERLQREYADRARRLAGKDIYSYFYPANLFILQQRQRAILALLKQGGYRELDKMQILEIGCGQGGVLHEYLGYGAAPRRLHGCDLLPDRLQAAHQRLPHLALTCADGQNLPYPAQFFDLELQFTVFSSILDERIKANVASEMLRTIKPGGLILWYDFWLNPTNRQTRGIRPTEIKRLFPGCTYEFHKITLAPPLARRIVRLSWGLALFLESIKIFNSHYLAVIRPRPLR